MPASSSPHVSRRQFLIGGSLTAGAVLLGACGSDETSTASPTTTTTGDDSLLLAQFSAPGTLVAGTTARVPIGVRDADALLPVDASPGSIVVEVFDPSGESVGGRTEVIRRADGLDRAYYPIEFDVERVGTYEVRASLGGQRLSTPIDVFDRAQVKVIQVGADMPSSLTPTTADPRGVTPICTREPVCPLHDVTVADALAAGEPFALLVASPEFCQISICGPVLDVLLDVRDAHPDLLMLHAEVFVDPSKEPKQNAPVVGDLGLHFEPCLVLVDADGKVADRVDVIFDRSETSERLARLA